MGEVLDAAIRSQGSGRLFTVGIPVFNGKSLLRNCFQSVLNSTLPRHLFEIVIVDDGSTEPETLAILSEYDQRLAADQGFFRVLTEKDNSGGAARPRNRILDEAVGEYVFFVDADDTIGSLALERIADELATAPADWVALNQVPVNGRTAVVEIARPRAEVPRIKALTTLTVHKVFRRAEIERQHLRFDVGLPSGQDVSFAFSYILNASRFVMLGGYDYYYLTRHTNNPNEPDHLSRRAKTPEAVIERSERILRSMLEALRKSDVPEAERPRIVHRIILTRAFLQQDYLRALVKAGPDSGGKALGRLADLLADPVVGTIDPEGVAEVTAEQLAMIANKDWPGLARLVRQASATQVSRGRIVAEVVRRGRRLVAVASGRARHGRVVNELTLLRRSVEDVREAQRRLEAQLQTEFRLRDGSRRD